MQIHEGFTEVKPEYIYIYIYIYIFVLILKNSCSGLKLRSEFLWDINV